MKESEECDKKYIWAQSYYFDDGYELSCSSYYKGEVPDVVVELQKIHGQAHLDEQFKMPI